MDWDVSADHSGAASPLMFRADPPDTPPLSSASSAGGSQGSIDIEKLKILLEGAAPLPMSAGRLRPTGKGHRRRSQMSAMSRTSVIESIAEEVTTDSGSPRAPAPRPPPVAVWDPTADRSSWRDSFDWDSEFGNTLRQYYAFQNEAREAVEESKNVWMDTEFSRFALQSEYLPGTSRCS